MAGVGLQRRRRPEDESRVLELRIHGVNNTPPASMLDVQPGEAERVDGDELGNFWRPSAAAVARLRDDHPGHPPRGVTREAYSWGALARINLASGGGALGLAAAAVTRLGWALLVPFGLVNVAFWSRRLSDGDAVCSWQRGATARAVRLAAAGLTLLLVGAACVVALDLVAAQCFAGPQRCDALPTPFHGLADQSPGRRLALLTAVPLAVLALLAGLGALTRSRYEQLAAMPAAAGDIGPVDTVPGGASSPGGPAPDTWARDQPPALLATPGFWSNAHLTSTQGKVHLAAGLAFVVVSSSWYYVVEPVAGCRGDAGTGPVRAGACLLRFAVLDGTPWGLAVTPGLALAALVALVLLLCWGEGWAEAARVPASEPETPRTPALARAVSAVLLVTAVTTIAHLVVLSREPLGRAGSADAGGTPLGPHPGGSEGSLVLLVLVLLPIALAALGWRRTPSADRPREMWGGRAPGIFLLLALGVALALTTFVVVGVGDWLNGDRSAGDLVRDVGATADVADGAPGADGAGAATGPHLRVPAFFVWYGMALIVGIAAFALAVTAMALRVRRDLPPAAGSPEDVAPGIRVTWGSPVEVARRSGAEIARRARRRTAAVAHRAEPAIGVLAGLAASCLTAALVLTALAWAFPGQWPDPAAYPTAPGGSDAPWVDLVDLAAWGAGGTAVLVLGGLVGGALAGRTRPLGLLWDLMCFLPRAGHPFGPPCYAERVVPELVRRYHEWLEDEAGHHGHDAEEADDDAARRRIVISAHSLGAVLAVASILAARVELGAVAVGRLALLTYGIQLRPYFGRIFPELLGPHVVGTARGSGARALTGDPWVDLVSEDSDATPGGGSPAAGEASPTSVRALLTDDRGQLRWVNLWRRTDYLGFPVDRYLASTVDRPAEEVDTSAYLPQVGTHSGYTRVPAYRDALVHLLGVLR